MAKTIAQEVEVTLMSYDPSEAFRQARGVVQGQGLVDGYWRKLTLVRVDYLWRNDPAGDKGTFHFKFEAAPY
jgi:hypothetical protein